MKIKMELLSDAIFGNGESVPGGEDIAVLCDGNGFPCYRGTSLKGIFREEAENLLMLTGSDAGSSKDKLNRLLGFSGDDGLDSGKVFFSDLTLPTEIRQAMLAEAGNDPQLVLDALTNVRTFTAMSDSGTVKEGSLRMARCVDQGLVFTGEIECSREDEKFVSETLSMIKWIGSLRNRGFGKVRISVV